MRKASIRDLRYNFAEVEALLEAGEEVQIIRRKQIVARLLPPVEPTIGKLPDFAGRMKRTFGKKRLAVSGADLIAEERDRY